jgi:uncharacterized protein
MSLSVPTQVDFEHILQTMTLHSAVGPYSIHGPDHWARVERNGLRLAGRNGADETVVRLFALFHDAERHNDGHDPQHGERAAQLAARLHGELFTIDQASLEILCLACELHHEGQTTDEVTIGTCWDADRLDLPRVGMIPSPEYMSTNEGKIWASAGQFDDEG